MWCSFIAGINFFLMSVYNKNNNFDCFKLFTMTELQISFLLSLLAFSYMNRAQPWIGLSLPLSAFSSQCCSVGIDYLRPEVSTVCAPYVFMCFSVSSIAACWEGRYLQRHCNRADTIAWLALPWGELEVVLDTREEWKGRKNRVEGKGWEYLMLAYRYIWNPICLISLFTPHFTPMTEL